MENTFLVCESRSKQQHGKETTELEDIVDFSDLFPEDTQEGELSAGKWVVEISTAEISFESFACSKRIALMSRE